MPTDNSYMTGPMNLVDEAELALKWIRDDDDLLPWYDDYPDTPGVEAWTDLRPTGQRRDQLEAPPGAETLGEMGPPQDTGTAVAAREGPGQVVEPKKRVDWLQIAKSQVGSPYVWADSNPQGAAGGPGAGFDCSGFTAWVYSEAFGVALPHLSEAQRTSTQKVSRKNLRPGDLIFFHYSDRNGPGAADHVEIYIGNGKSIGTPSADRGVGVQNVDWDAFMQGGRVEGVTVRTPPKETKQNKNARKGRGDDFWNDPTLVPASLGMQPNLAEVQVDLMMGMRDEIGRRNDADDKVPKMSGSAGMQKIKAQLYRGFMDAGRPDLAKMVNTPEFKTWIEAESSWNPGSVSRYFSGHGRNAGLFQFAFLDRDWVTRDVTLRDGNWSYVASPYEQAQYVVQYFNLTPGDIRRYASQIRNGTYGGWG